METFSDAGQNPTQRDDAKLHGAVGRRLRALRYAAGYPKAVHFAEAIGISRSQLSHLESGYRHLSDLVLLAKIVDKTQANLDWLLLGNASWMPYGLMQRILEHQARLDAKHPRSDTIVKAE